MRVLQVRSRDLDLDTLSRAVGALADHDVVHPRLVEDSWPSIVREALMLRRRAREFDAVSAYGAAAIRAATLWPSRLTLEEPGLNESPFQSSNPPVNEKPVEMKLPRRRAKEEVREELEIDDNAIVVAAPGSSLRDCGHRLAGHALGLLHYLDERFVLLLWGHGVEGRHLLRLAKGRWSMFVMARPDAAWHDVIDAADAAIYCGSGAVESVVLRTVIDRQLPTAALRRRPFVELQTAGLMHDIETRSPRAVAKAILRSLQMTPDLAELNHGNT
jgi:hypothetical protein